MKTIKLMSLFEQITTWLGIGTPEPTLADEVRLAVDAGRQAKYAEDYDQALTNFDRAQMLTKQSKDSSAETAIELHRAEVYIRQGRWDDAESLLNTLYLATLAHSDSGQVAFVRCLQGVLAQERGDWDGAREHYEDALERARVTATATAEGRALGHLADVYLHDGNASYATHLLNDALPRLNLTGDIELSSYFVGKLGEAKIASGHDAEGRHLLERALQLADHINYRIYQRYWLQKLGQIALDEGRYQDAVLYFNRALDLYSQDHPSQAQILLLASLSRTYTYLREHQQSLYYARQAQTLSADLEDPATEATVQAVLGGALRASGQGHEALEHLHFAADHQREHGSDLNIQVETLRNLAAAQAEAGDDGAVETYQQALSLVDNSAANLEIAQTRRDLGLTYFRRRQYQEAISEWLGALAIYEEKRYHAQVARLYTDIATARKQLGQGQRAIRDFEQALIALNLVDEEDIETRGVVLANTAIAYAEQGDIESAEAFFTEAISIAEQTSDGIAEATRRGNFGWLLLTLGRTYRAVNTLEQALKLSEQHNLPLQAAVQRDNLGLAHDLFGDYHTAVDYHRRALKKVRQLNSAVWVANIQVSLATSLLSLLELDEADELLGDALKYGRDNGLTELIVRALNQQGRLAMLRARPEDATVLLEEAIFLARRADLRRYLAEALSLRSEHLAALGQPDDADAHWTEARKFFTMLRMPQSKLEPGWLAQR